MRKTRVRLWLALATAIVLAGLSAFVGFGSVAQIFTAGHGGVGLGTSITTAVISIAVAAACVRWGVHVEHRLRTHGAGTDGVGRGDAHSHGARSQASRRAGGVVDAGLHAPGTRRARLHHHRHGPASVTAGALVFTLVGLGMAIGVVQSFDSWRLSRYVQTHGERIPGMVLTVRDIAHHGRYSTWYTADVGVFLQRPVAGKIITIVHDPAAAQVIPGQTVTVLVDPRRPSYAELPGSSYGDAATWIALGVFAAIMLAFATVYWYELAVRIRQRHRAPAASLSPQPSP